MEIGKSRTNIEPFKSIIIVWCSLIFVYIIIDFFRVFFDNSKYLLVFNDLFIFFLGSYIVFKRRNWYYFVEHVPINILISLFFFVILIFFQLFNLNVINFSTNIAGLRTYLLPILGIIVGYEFGVSNTLNNARVYKFVLLVLLLVVGFSVFQILIDTSKLGDIALSLVTSREHAFHSHEDQSISLTSSFFASGKKLGRFLTFLYLVYLGLRFNLKKQYNILVFITFLVGLISSGSREAVYAFFFINVISFLKFSNIRSIINLLFYSFFSFLFFLFFEINSDSITRLNFLVAFDEDFGERLIGLFPFSLIKFDNDSVFFGMGLGKYGQEAILVQSISDLGEKYLSIFFDSNYSNVISDSGIVKVVIETGIIGFFFFGLLICGITYFALSILIKVLYNSDRIIFNMCLYIILWFFFFLKAHSILSDIFLTFNFFFAFGYIAAFKRKSILKYD